MLKPSVLDEFMYPIYRESQRRQPREAVYSKTHWNRYLEVWLTIMYAEPKVHAKILECGTLFGHLAMGLKKLGYEVETLDTADEAARYHTQIESYGIREKVCDLETRRIPYLDSSFDLVLLSEVLEHLNPYKLQHVISEISRVLKTGGHLVVTTPNGFNLGARLRMLIGHEYLCPQHVREYSLRELVAILQGRNIFYASGINDSNSNVETRLRTEKSWYSLNLDMIHWGTNRIRLARSLLWPFKHLYPRFRGTIFIVAVKT
jgi:2-polyprenyl-3-methyl-5-hydroxy-6-metoxy-1,4-benzoquinol methylase